MYLVLMYSSTVYIYIYIDEFDIATTINTI